MKRYTKRSQKLPTLTDVAHAAKVSIGTASRVINGRTNVDPAIRDRVLAVIDRLGYRPNVLAQGMRMGATRTVGIIVRDISASGLASFVRAAQEELFSAGYLLLLANSNDRTEREIALLRMFADRKIDGLIMTTASENDRAAVAARMEAGVPIVLLDREPQSGEDAVLVRHGDGVQQAVTYLASLGHKRIGLITGHPDVYAARDRVSGYKAGLRAAGLPFAKELVRTASFSAEAGQLEMSGLLGLHQRPTAVIAGGASLLGGVLLAARGLGMNIPADLSVIGSADTELSMLVTPPVTIIKWSYAELGRLTANMLLTRLGAEKAMPSRTIVLQAELVIRGSCAAKH